MIVLKVFLALLLFGGLALALRRAYISIYVRGYKHGKRDWYGVGDRGGHTRGIRDSLRMAELELRDDSPLGPRFSTPIHRIIGRIKSQLPEG